ncbi:hypothetical protein BC629DRAFT_1471221, partial [Irpex lacteus]
NKQPPITREPLHSFPGFGCGFAGVGLGAAVAEDGVASADAWAGVFVLYSRPPPLRLPSNQPRQFISPPTQPRHVLPIRGSLYTPTIHALRVLKHTRLPFRTDSEEAAPRSELRILLLYRLLPFIFAALVSSVIVHTCNAFARGLALLPADTVLLPYAELVGSL